MTYPSQSDGAVAEPPRQHITWNFPPRWRPIYDWRREGLFSAPTFVGRGRGAPA